MYDLARFSLQDMTECGTALRTLSRDATSMDEAAARIVAYLYTHLVDKQTGANGCALIRLFKTHPYGGLDEDCQRLVRDVLGQTPHFPSMKCFTLIGTAGERPEWNVKENSRRYRAIPLADQQFVAQFPMLSQLLKQFGVTLPAEPRTDSTVLLDRDEKTYNVFHVPEAAGSPFVPVQQDFVIRYHVRSVLGFGGLLPSNELFAIILFSKVRIPKETAELFRTLALSVKLAILPYDGAGVSLNRPTSSSSHTAIADAPVNAQLQRYQAERETLAQLLTIHEQIVMADIIARRRAEEDLRASQAFSHNIIASSLDMIIVVDNDRRIIEFNPAAEEIFGYRAEDVLGQPIDRLYADPEQGRQVNHATVMKGRHAQEVLSRRKNGEVFPCWLSASILRDANGNAIGAMGVSRDITERKRADESLRESRERFRGAFDHASIGMSLVAPDGRFLEVNQSLCKLLGYSEQELLATTFQAITHPDDLQANLASLDRTLTGAIQTYQMEKRYLHKVGHIVWVLLNVSLVRNPQGKPLYFISQIQDITERKRTEQALRESEDRLQVAVEGANTGIWDWDLRTNRVHFSPLWKKMLGYEPHEIQDTYAEWETRLHPDDRERALAAIRTHIDGVTPQFELEYRMRHKDGAFRWILARGVSMKDAQGKPYRVAGSHVDITRRAQAENALRQAEEQYRSIFENAVEGIFQTTPDGKFVTANPALARLHGYDSPEDMIAAITDIGRQFYVDPKRRDEFIHLMQRQGAVTGFESQVYRKDGTKIWISESVRALRDADGAIVGYEGSVENITERQRAQEQLHSTLDRLRTLSRRLDVIQEEERTRIARELHDELGVGLTCLKIDLSRLNLIAGKSIRPSERTKMDAKVRSMIQLIDTTIRSVQRIVTELRPAVLDDLGLVAAIEWQAQDFQSRTGIVCTCAVSQDDIHMDSERATVVFRICQEALTNVARHAQATAVSIRLEDRHGTIVLDVRDNGQGIPEDKLSDPQSLGLLGMRERARLFGGEVIVSGQPGEGTTITLRLPRPSLTLSF